MATAAPNGSPGASPVGPGLDRARMRRRVLYSAFRIIIVTTTLMVVYASAPIGRRPDGSIAIRLLLGLLVVGVVLGWQIRMVMRSPHPALRGVEAVATSVPLLVLTFAASYFAASMVSPDSFSETLSRIDAVYFALTVLATVGFGDIAAQTEAARLLVTFQMLVNLVFTGLVIKVLLGAVRRRRDVLEITADTPATGESSR